MHKYELASLKRLALDQFQAVQEEHVADAVYMKKFSQITGTLLAYFSTMMPHLATLAVSDGIRALPCNIRKGDLCVLQDCDGCLRLGFAVLFLHADVLDNAAPQFTCVQSNSNAPPRANGRHKGANMY